MPPDRDRLILRIGQFEWVAEGPYAINAQILAVVVPFGIVAIVYFSRLT